MFGLLLVLGLVIGLATTASAGDPDQAKTALELLNEFKSRDSLVIAPADSIVGPSRAATSKTPRTLGLGITQMGPAIEYADFEWQNHTVGTYLGLAVRTLDWGYAHGAAIDSHSGFAFMLAPGVAAGLGVSFIQASASATVGDYTAYASRFGFGLHSWLEGGAVLGAACRVQYGSAGGAGLTLHWRFE